MIGDQDRWQEDIFVAGPLSDLIPDDHIVKQVDKVLDLSWLRDVVRDCYDEQQGRPSIDPESALRLMLAGYFQGIVHDRKLMREACVNLAIRWFAGYRLHERLPDHSSLTRIRQRWGRDRFRRIFEKTVGMCIDAGLVSCEAVHMDATLIRADVSWGSLVQRHVEEVLEVNEPGDGPEAVSKRDKGGDRKKAKKVSKTDPEATMATSNKKERLKPSYKQHTSVDEANGVIVDVELTTGENSEGGMLPDALDRVEALTSKEVRRVTADRAYSSGGNYAECEEREMEAVIPPQRERRKAKRIPLRRFKYDGRHKTVVCPFGKRLHRRYKTRHGWVYRGSIEDCGRCDHRQRCVSPKAKTRTVVIVDGYEALLRARRKWVTDGVRLRSWYSRHRWRVEGVQGVSKTQHGLGRAVRRGLANVAIQVYLTAAVMNLKSLARLFLWLFRCIEDQYRIPGGAVVASDGFFSSGPAVRIDSKAIA